MPWLSLKSLVPCAAALVLLSAAVAQQLPTERLVGDLDVVARFDGAIPTGVAVSRTGRVFVNFPQWGDKFEATVTELKDGKAVPYPAGVAQWNAEHPSLDKPAETLLSVQSVVVDQKNRLWLLDTGKATRSTFFPGGAKLVGVDLATDKIFQTIPLGADVAPANGYMNDVRFDYTHGAAGTAYITDSGARGIVVVDLATGKSWKRLQTHPSTGAEPGYHPFVEGESMVRPGPDGKLQAMRGASDGIAISPDYQFLYYCSLAGRHLYRVPTALLADANASDEATGKAVEDLGEKGLSDGMESDAQGNVYFGDIENNSVRRWSPNGSFKLIAHDPRILWADTLALGADGWLYFTVNQLHRRMLSDSGPDLRVKPYVLFRVKVDAKPIP